MTRSGSPGRERETRSGGQASEERRAPVPPPGTPAESTFPSELPSARSRGLPRAPRSGASATALRGQNSDRENARVESDKATERAVLGVVRDNTQLFKLFADNPDFRRWLADTAFRLAYEATG